jgi:hypothetical protein
MMGRSGTAFALAVALALTGRSHSQNLTDATYAKWRDYLLPAEKDLAYRSIPWRASYWDAVVEAQAKDKPILLWAMNGHPLGCT